MKSIVSLQKKSNAIQWKISCSLEIVNEKLIEQSETVHILFQTKLYVTKEALYLIMHI